MTTPFRVVARFLEAAQPPKARQEAVKHTHPINKPKGIDKTVVKEQGKDISNIEESVSPHRRDIRPEDVFPGLPNNVAVLSLAQTGKDLQKALDKQVPKDKGYDTVSNLSQYLIRTEGGGGTKPVGKK